MGFSPYHSEAGSAMPHQCTSDLQKCSSGTGEDPNATGLPMQPENNLMGRCRTWNAKLYFTLSYEQPHICFWGANATWNQLHGVGILELACDLHAMKIVWLCLGTTPYMCFNQTSETFSSNPGKMIDPECTSYPCSCHPGKEGFGNIRLFLKEAHVCFQSPKSMPSVNFILRPRDLPGSSERGGWMQEGRKKYSWCTCSDVGDMERECSCNLTIHQYLKPRDQNQCVLRCCNQDSVFAISFPPYLPDSKNKGSKSSSHHESQVVPSYWWGPQKTWNTPMTTEKGYSYCCECI